MEVEDVGGATTGRIEKSVILDGIVRSVATYLYALMIQEEIVTGSVGRIILKLDASSKLNRRKKNKKNRSFLLMSSTRFN